MYKIHHKRKDFIINETVFKSKEEAEQHMNVIRKYAKEWVQGGTTTQEQADKYVSGFKIKEIL